MCASTRTSVCACARLHVEGDAAVAEEGREKRVEAQVGAHVEHHVGRRVGRVARDLREQDLAEEVRDGACGARGAAAAAAAAAADGRMVICARALENDSEALRGQQSR